MAHAYTPGLRVTGHAVIRRERRLPLKGEVLARIGDAVDADTVVARTELPGNVQTINVASRLALDPARVPDSLVAPVGSAVAKGDAIAEGKSLFGLMKQRVEAPVAGTIESVSPVTGQVILREAPIPVEVHAYVRGTVAEVIEGEGVVVEAVGALIQGIFGVGGETFGPLRIAAAAPDEELAAARLSAEHRGAVVVGGSYVSYATLMRARELGVAAVVVGGFDDGGLKRLLGRDLGVAITGAEDLGLTLVLTEGFGRIRMADRTWRLLAAHEGRQASVSGATQIRAGVLRPEIVIPGVGERSGDATSVGRRETASDGGAGIEIGSLLRVIREPFFGRIGRVTALPAELQPLETEARVRVMEVEFADDGARAIVPRANVERIED
ncbi:MAG: hypothetical protein HY076_02215 [Candidatus Eisenbacteria bacterium]|uniref:RnfC Barrel sandwich hybrid domain-containing protein n=1 Tax=Eiseniibacteriota bacterium TaxID=2212470 RepID=A0A9D6L5M7_UNCEI|nr:hypothetical protein [Candidatus Eisenbacteria bacterium]MBI3539071.1 hypothetical protein [Candidatus Eisenbacteria bacterium]